MISKKIPRGSDDRFGCLTECLAATKDQDEKLDCLWMVNCDVGETLNDLNLSIKEIEATQNLNIGAKGAKTYHLMIRFQSGGSLPEEALRDINQRFAACLGFEDHQRVVAAHKNTENFHVHVAYNMIHPKTLNIHHPRWDYYARDRVCRAIELNMV